MDLSTLHAVVTTDTGTVMGSQDYTRTVTVRAADRVPFRITMRRDTYDHQSYARVERWDGERWCEVLHWGGETDFLKTMPSPYGRDESHNKYREVEVNMLIHHVLDLALRSIAV